MASPPRSPDSFGPVRPCSTAAAEDGPPLPTAAEDAPPPPTAAEDALPPLLDSFGPLRLFSTTAAEDVPPPPTAAEDAPPPSMDSFRPRHPPVPAEGNASPQLPSGGPRRSPRTPCPEPAEGNASTQLPSGGPQRSPMTTRSPEKGGRAAKRPKLASNSAKKPGGDHEVLFVGNPVPDEEARVRWPHHYVKKEVRKSKGHNSAANENNDDDGDELILDVECHYFQANVSRCIFDLGDCAYVKGESGKPNYVGRILEFFETIKGEYYFTVQWFFRAEDTVMKEQASFHDKHRLFFSDLKDDNLLDCIVSKVTVVQIPPSVDLKPKSIPSCDFYYNMKYSVEYSTFYSMEIDDLGEKSDVSSSNCTGTTNINSVKCQPFSKQVDSASKSDKTELAQLDLYSGCGGMSTGLCLGAQLAGVNVVTRWAVDFDEAACQTLKLNHPETQVRNEPADDFYSLLKQWEILCKRYVVGRETKRRAPELRVGSVEGSKTNIRDGSAVTRGEYEVSRLVDVCYGDPSNVGKRGLKFKVRWKGYNPSDDTWESIEALSKCQECIEAFVREGFNSRILPLPGSVDVICGGPPCQGISGLNRFRNFDAPLDDEKNRQIIVFMDIVQFLKPKYVLMENVVDILKFAKGVLGRYALSRIVFMNYQARLGIMAAGCYGLPQFRLRAFILGCHPNEILPQFPLPTHEVIVKGGTTVEFERNIVAYDEGQRRHLQKELVLEDVLSDLPAVTNQEIREQMPYGRVPQTEFQKYIRTLKFGMPGSVGKTRAMLYDHRPLQQSEDDYLRICQIPKRKGANFRDLPGVIVGSDNIVQFDPTMERVLLPSGKSLVPDYAMNLWHGKSSRTFGRVWWDETVPTVLTNPDTHIQAVLHPEQDRVFTIRECARLQGFPDYYRFCGTVKERYRQIGNAVAIPVGRALGYAVALAWLRQSGDEPLMTLPSNFSHSTMLQHVISSSSEVQDDQHLQPQVADTVHGELYTQSLKLEGICNEVKLHVEVLTRELEGVPLTPDAVASISRLQAIGNLTL